MPKVKENNCICMECGIGFHRSPSKIIRSKRIFCSRTCRGKWESTRCIGVEILKAKEPNRVCKHCGIPFYTKNKLNGFYCSKACYSASMVKKKIECNCKHCKKSFMVVPSTVKFGGGKYCSAECFFASIKVKKKICESCGAEFIPAKKNTRFCSHKCYGSWLTKERISRICKFCGKEFQVLQSQLKPNVNSGTYCSQSCNSRASIGCRGRNWRGGITPENKAARSKIEYFEWKKKIFERDNYTCQHCGKAGGELNAHHIILFSVNKELRLDITNGITLCKACHRLEHNRLMKEEKIKCE